MVVREESDPTAQKENEASKQGGNTSQVGSGKSESTSSYEKGNSADSKTKISRKVAPYASGAGSWAVTAATKEPKQTYKMVSQIDPRKSISEILGSADLSDPATRVAVSAYMADREEARYQAVVAQARLMGIPLRIDGPGNQVRILYDLHGTFPLYRKTLNANAAISTGANLIRQTAPYNLSGAGLKVGVWDGGSVRNTHQEFRTNRVTKKNSSAANNAHATHVAGTIGATGVQTNAKGMAPLVSIDSYDWTSDYAEMTAAGAALAADGASKIPISNHSYGYDLGTNAVDYDPYLGVYEDEASATDSLASGLPFYQIFWAAGNEQDLYTSRNGYQSITFNGLAKNVITVGAADDAVTSGVRDVSKGTLAYFSSMGPCDDGRIKPDIVANGVSVYSTVSTSDTAYDGTYSGTSMATPNAAGSATLLQQLYRTNFSGQLMRASTLKALMIHTADDVGRPGPDYQYGWGYLNVKAAADVILAHKASLAAPKMITNAITAADKIRSVTFEWDGSSPVRATLVWTDPAGAAQPTNNTHSRTRNLVNDLDLKITAPNGTTSYLPYVMPFVGVWTPNSMTNNAVTGTNRVDNVERIDIPAPTQAGTYTVTVGMYGTNALTGSSQGYSLIVTGGQNLEANPPPVVNITAPADGVAVLPGTPINITATAMDMAVGGVSGSVTKVEFFEGETLLGEDTTSPYSFSWTPSTTGVRVLTAKATDNETASAVSSPVNVTVLVGDGRPMITSFAPTGGVAGDSVVILGNNLGIATSVQFGALAGAFTANNASQITATVPVNAVTAPITVSNSYGSATTSSNFTIIPIVFREDFALLTAGDNTTSGGSSTPWVGNTNFPTNTVVKAYQAGGAVRMGAKGALGSITSRAINLAGNGGAFNISFKVKGWSTKEGDIKVTAGSQSQNVTYEATMSESFESKTLKFTGGTSATTIMIETTAGRAYIDDVTVTAEAPSSPPVITSPSTAGGIAGQAFSYQITASNSPTSFGASNLPSGLSVDTISGVISGTPAAAGTTVATISATSSAGVGTNALTITILPSGGGGSVVVTNGLLAGWDVRGQSNFGVSPLPVTVHATNLITVGGLTRSAGVTVPGSDAAANAWGGTGWTNTNSFASLTLAVPAGYRFSVTNIDTFDYRRSGTGPASGALQYSTNGTTFVAITNVSFPVSTSGGGAAGPIPLDGVAALQNIPSGTTLTLRIVNTNGASSGTWYVFDRLGTTANDFVISGTVESTNAAPSPSISSGGSLAAVNTVYGTASTNPTSFTLSGANLAEGIKVAPPAGFEVSAGNTNGFAGQGNSIIVGSAGTVASTTIFVRLAADTDVGNYSGNIVCSSVGASNASVATVASTVSAKPLTVTANLLRKTYGLEDPELTYNSSEAAPFSGGLTRAAGESVGTYAITQGDLSAGPNYTISFTGNNFEIMRKSLNITASDMTKTFGQTLVLGTEQTNFTSSGLVNGETVGSVTLTASGGTQADDAVGFYTLTPSQATGGTFSLNNYTTIYNSGTLTVRAGESTFSGWAGEGVLMTPELLMKYAIGGAASPSAKGEPPVVGMDGSNLTLTAIVRKDSTLKVEGQAVANLEDYGTPASVTSITGTSQGVIQGDLPSDCERRIFKSPLTGSKSFLRLSVQKQ